MEEERGGWVCVCEREREKVGNEIREREIERVGNGKGMGERGREQERVGSGRGSGREREVEWKRVREIEEGMGESR